MDQLGRVKREERGWGWMRKGQVRVKSGGERTGGGPAVGRVLFEESTSP